MTATVPVDDPRLQRYLDRYIATRRAGLRVGLVIFTAITAGCAWLAWTGESPATSRGGAILAALFGGITLFASLIPLLTAGRGDEGVRALRERRDEIVWAYGLQPRGVMLATRSGERFLLGHALAADLIELAPLLPRATMGYTPERATAYDADPSGLVRS